jgi:FkbM family methyltransferase
MLYRSGIALLQALNSVAFLGRPLDSFCRIWQRHRKLHAHLRALDFDGVIDGGANVGEFAAIVRATLPNADLICVEPHPASAEVLRKAGYKVVQAALWNEATQLALHQAGASSTSCTVFGEDLRKDEASSWQVPAVRLDSLAISGSRLLVKLDLQGAEPEALAGMDALWHRCVGILLEVSIGRNGNYESLRELLWQHRFREYSTTNELSVDGRVIEADKLWLRA